MKKRILTPLICAGLVAQVEAAEHRLAFSKSAELEVFVEHADGQPWCSEALKLRFQGNGASREEQVSRIMPKLGVLLGRECPQAKSASWTSINASGDSIANGQASAEGQWQLEIASGYGSEPTAQAPSVAAARPPQQNDSTPAQQESGKQAPASAQVQPAAADTAAAKPASPVTAKAAPEEPAQTQASVNPPAPQAETPAVLQSDQPVAQAALPQAPREEAKAQPETEPADVSGVDLVINGWHPRPSIEAIRETEFSLPIKDQNGCIFNTDYQFRVDPEFLRGQSENLNCNRFGLVEGKGSFRISRTDGRLLGTVKANFSYGIPFSDGEPLFSIQKITPQFLYAHLGADPVNRVHYLLQLPRHSQGVWNLRQADLLALTDNLDLFRDAQRIEQVIRRGTALIPTRTDLHANISFLALTSLESHFAGKHFDKEQWLYSTRIRRNRNSEDWAFNLQQADNYLFEREYRAAEQARREQERLEQERKMAEKLARQQRILQLKQQSWAEQRNLDLFEDLAEQPPLERRNDWIREVRYRFLKSSSYTRLLQGDEQEWQQIVHLDDKDDGIWTLDYPYPARLTSEQPLSEGWYQITGTIRVDENGATDSEGLPLMHITASQAQPCKDQLCLENFDPLLIVRNRLNDPEWDPKQAQALIDRVNNGEFD